MRRVYTHEGEFYGLDETPLANACGMGWHCSSAINGHCMVSLLPPG